MSQTQISPALAAAENYEKLVATYTMRPFVQILLDLVNLQPGERVVDVACGTGAVARQAAPRVGAQGTVIGVDINSAMLTVAGSLPVPDGAAITWREGSALSLPLPSEAFDVVLCHQGLQFFPDRLAALREMHRVLSPGGRAAVAAWRSIEHNPASHLIWDSIARHLHTPIAALLPSFSLGDAAELRRLMEAAGFARVTVVERSQTVRQPWEPQLIAKLLASVAGLVPAYAAMSPEEQAALAQSVEDEIGAALQAYVDGSQQLFPLSEHIALGEKT